MTKWRDGEIYPPITSLSFLASSSCRKGFSTISKLFGSPCSRLRAAAVYPEASSTLSFGEMRRASTASCTPFMPPGMITSESKRSIGRSPLNISSPCAALPGGQDPVPAGPGSLESGVSAEFLDIARGTIRAEASGTPLV